MEIIECTTLNHLIDHYHIRKLVFIDEQKVSYEDEFDLAEKQKLLLLFMIMIYQLELQELIF